MEGLLSTGPTPSSFLRNTNTLWPKKCWHSHIYHTATCLLSSVYISTLHMCCQVLSNKFKHFIKLYILYITTQCVLLTKLSWPYATELKLSFCPCVSSTFNPGECVWISCSPCRYVGRQTKGFRYNWCFLWHRAGWECRTSLCRDPGSWYLGLYCTATMKQSHESCGC